MYFIKFLVIKIKSKTLLLDKIDKEFFEIIHTTDLVKSTDSPLEGAKRGKNTSMWLAIESVKKKEADIVVISWKYRCFIGHFKTKS